ncbi:MAG: hypothetical protein IPK16_16565 [Anaerolineales bacterium]|nr:hypothetical protein [Anaerolineales bacterium]
MRKYLNTILLLLLAGGFVVIVAELYLYQHWEGTQLIGFAASVIGLLAVLLGLFARGTFRVILALLLVVISISGLIGTREHFESLNEGREATMMGVNQLASAEAGALVVAAASGAGAVSSAIMQEDDEGGEGGERGERGGEESAPPLAPIGISGLALMGAAVLLAKEDPTAKQGKS